MSKSSDFVREVECAGDGVQELGRVECLFTDFSREVISFVNVA